MTDEQRVVANKLAKQREYFTHLAPIGETNKTKTICFDLETTGVNNELDEVLEITILDGNFNILLNTYVKPIFTTSWKNAEAVHHISYDMVKNKPTLQQLAPLIKGIFDNADVIVGYCLLLSMAKSVKSMGVINGRNYKIVLITLDINLKHMTVMKMQRLHYTAITR